MIMKMMMNLNDDYYHQQDENVMKNLLEIVERDILRDEMNELENVQVVKILSNDY
jgi:hypothetical protein